MKAAFFFDTYLLKKGNDYYGMTLNYDFLKERYLSYYDNLIISTRVKEYDIENGNVEGYKTVNGDNIEAIPIIEYKTIPDGFLKKNSIKREIENIIDGVDMTIIRMPSMIGNIACEVCEKRNSNYKIELVACPWDGYINHHNRSGKIVAPYMFLETKKHLKKAKDVLYVTDRFLQKRYPTDGNAISCSDVALNDFDTNVLNKRLHKIENMNSQQNIILATVANVGLKYKGQEYVIRALAELKNNGNDSFQYLLIGNGNQEYLENLVTKLNLKDEVMFLGSLKHEEIFNMLDQIDVYIQPSLQEGMPRALLEAMSRACPSFGSSAGGIPELLSHEYVFKKKKVEDIVNLLSAINKDKLMIMAKNCFNRAQDFSTNKLTEKRNEFYMR